MLSDIVVLQKNKKTVKMTETFFATKKELNADQASPQMGDPDQ
jgi:hypothetical protein